jgi:hypothetical protein
MKIKKRKIKKNKLKNFENLFAFLNDKIFKSIYLENTKRFIDSNLPLNFIPIQNLTTQKIAGKSDDVHFIKLILYNINIKFLKDCVF